MLLSALPDASVAVATATDEQPTAVVLEGTPLVSTDVQGVAGQQVFLDFDGAQDVSYDGPVHVGPIDVPAFAVPGSPDDVDAVIGSIVSSLNERFEALDVHFTATEPLGEFSTVYVGGNGADFASYGNYFGLAEQVDRGNLDPSDEAFVFSEAIPGFDDLSLWAERVTDTIAHEAGHLLGFEHNAAYAAEHEHGGPLDHVAAVVPIANSNTGFNLGSNDNVTIRYRTTNGGKLEVGSSSNSVPFSSTSHKLQLAGGGKVTLDFSGNTTENLWFNITSKEITVRRKGLIIGTIEFQGGVKVAQIIGSNQDDIFDAESLELFAPNPSSNKPTFDGKDGNDFFDAAELTVGLNVNLLGKHAFQLTNKNLPSKVRGKNVEAIQGTDFNDTFKLSSSSGFDGQIDGGLGLDTVDLSGREIDLQYEFKSVTNLLGGTDTGAGFAVGLLNDTTPNYLQRVFGIENIQAGGGDDLFRFNDESQKWLGDSINAGRGRNDISFASYSGVLDVNLGTESVLRPGGAATNFTIEKIENVTTGRGNDTIVGTSATNRLNGGGGRDSIDPARGQDHIVFDANDYLNSSTGTWGSIRLFQRVTDN